MTREKINGPFFIKDSKNGKVEIPGMQLPTFDDFIDGAKSLDYKDLIGEADDMNAYKEAVASTLKENVKKSWDRDMETEKMRFKRSVMKDMAMQEMFTFMEQDIENMPTQSFSSKNDNEVYGMFTLIYNSFLDYSMSELETFRKSIQDIDQKKKRYIINLSKEGVNDAVYALWLLGQADRTHTESVATIAKDAQDSKTQNIADQEKKSDQPYGYLQTYARFFSIFKNTTYARPIIDTIALEKFRYQLTQEVSTDQSYLERTNTTLAFDEFIDKSQQLPDVENIFPKDDIT